MNIEAIRRIAEKYDAKTTGDLGLLFTDLKTGETVTVNPDKELPAASTFKVFLLAEFLRQCEEGKYNLMDRHELKEAFVSPGSGVLCDLIPGMNLTLLDYARLMMMLSDNTATDYLYSLTGRDNIKNNVIDAFGLSRTKCDYPCKLLIETYFDPAHKKVAGERNWRNTDDYLCLTAENDSTSPNDMAKVLKMAYDKTLFSPWVSEQMIDIMKRCHTNSRIPRSCPVMWRLPTRPVPWTRLPTTAASSIPKRAITCSACSTTAIPPPRKSMTPTSRAASVTVCWLRFPRRSTPPTWNKGIKKAPRRGE